MSYSIVTKGTGDKAVKMFHTHCNHTGCKATVSSTVGKGDSWLQARKAGWFSDSAANHRCPAHRPSALRAQARKADNKANKAVKQAEPKKAVKQAKSAKRAASKK